MTDPKRSNEADGWDCPRCRARNGAYRKACWHCDDGRRPEDKTQC